MHIMILSLVLFGVWFVFSGFTDVFFLALGASSCLLALYLCKRMQVLGHVCRPLYNQPKLLLYAFWLFKEIMVSSFKVMVLAWQPRPDIKPKMAWIKVHDKSDSGHTLYANSITLTPGTVCIDVMKDKMQVHALHEESIQELKEGVMEQKVQQVIGASA